MSDTEEGGHGTNQDAPAPAHLSRDNIDAKGLLEVYQQWGDGELTVRPVWAPTPETVAQITVSLDVGEVTMALDEEETDSLIDELEHAKKIAAEYSEE